MLFLRGGGGRVEGGAGEILSIFGGSHLIVFSRLCHSRLLLRLHFTGYNRLSGSLAHLTGHTGSTLPDDDHLLSLGRLSGTT